LSVFATGSTFACASICDTVRLCTGDEKPGLKDGTPLVFGTSGIIRVKRMETIGMVTNGYYRLLTFTMAYQEVTESRR